jgi:hypothetical protein
LIRAGYARDPRELIERYTWRQITYYFHEERIRNRDAIADHAVAVNRGMAAGDVSDLRRR